MLITMFKGGVKLLTAYKPRRWKMLQATQVTVERGSGLEIVDMYNDLLKEWLYDLSYEEKLVWLWNAKVEMVRIKQRRQLPGL